MGTHDTNSGENNFYRHEMENYVSYNTTDTYENGLFDNVISPDNIKDVSKSAYVAQTPDYVLPLNSNNNDNSISILGMSSQHNNDLVPDKVDLEFENLETTYNLTNYSTDTPTIEVNSESSNSLNNIRISNANRLIIAQLNINSLKSKFDALKNIISGKIDILVITESKLDKSFLTNEFLIEGFSVPFRCDREYSKGGGVIIYVREDIPCRELKSLKKPDNFEGIVLEINLRKAKWLLFGGYNPHKENTPNFLTQLTPILDHYLSKYDNYLLIGDFNSEIKEESMKEFCDIYNLSNLIKEPTCFKNPLNPSSIDVMLTNRARQFQNSHTVETGLSDHHKMTITVLKTFFQKQSPTIVKYRDYKNFNVNLFRNQLLEQLTNIGDDITYAKFETIFIHLLDFFAPMKTKYIRANNGSFMNKTLSKAVMTRSRLRNKFLKDPSDVNKNNYKKQRNYCTNLFRSEKRKFYDNIDISLITDNKTFWKTVKPLFSEKHFGKKKVILVEGENIISNDKEVAETMNDFFSNIVENLDINRDQDEHFTYDCDQDFISNIVLHYKDHPSIIKIRETTNINDHFHFTPVSVEQSTENIKGLDKKKASTFNGIPSKILSDNYDIISPFVTKMYNDSNINMYFPDLLKLADITPIYKKDDTTNKENYRPVSILPSVSKIFERNMYDQISNYIDKFLSLYLCGFRKGYSTQHSLTVMLEKWRKALDNGKLAGALLTDLSKAFDCLNHNLLIAKLHAYGFDYNSLAYIYSYLSNRKHRTKVNNSFSAWAPISSGVPQGSILGPLLFNIYMNDIFFFINKTELANYADDNTLYTINKNIDEIIKSLENDSSILIKWFSENYLVMNADKSQLLITKHLDKAFIEIDNEIIENSNTVKLLGITIDNKLDFTEHVTKICNKASLKLHAIARISKFMNSQKLRILVKAFFESQFSYCPLVWMFHSRTLNNRINKLHERALRLVYKEPHLTFEQLLEKDNSFTIHHRNLQKLAIEIYKIINNESPPIMKQIFPTSTNPYDLRNVNPFISTNVHSVYNGTETICYRGPQIWTLVPEDIKKSKSCTEFKKRIRSWKPNGCPCRICKIFIANVGFI